MPEENEKNISYKIITSTSLPDLEEQVRTGMTEGWKPTGGVTVYNDLYTKYVQAMVKEPTPTPPPKKTSTSSTTKKQQQSESN